MEYSDLVGTVLVGGASLTGRGPSVLREVCASSADVDVDETWRISETRLESPFPEFVG